LKARKSGDFIADVERQFEWYVANAQYLAKALSFVGWGTICLGSNFPKATSPLPA
jgi:hypothetical protein